MNNRAIAWKTDEHFTAYKAYEEKLIHCLLMQYLNIYASGMDWLDIQR